MSLPAIRVPTVPMTAPVMPTASSPSSSSRVVVVFPWVPVTPIICMPAAGSP